jgi:very-short-patch-repair endonuclease
VTFEFELMASDLPADLVVQKKKTWIDLAAALGKLEGIPDRAGSLLDPPTVGAIKRPDSWLAALDLRYLPTPWSKLLWGPPGAGKTYALAQFVKLLVDGQANGERVLMVAPSNVAVDVATLQTVEALKSTETGRNRIQNREVLRYGYPRDEGILSRPELLGPAELEELSNGIGRCAAELRELRKRRAGDNEIAAMQSQMRQLAEKRRQSVQLHISKSRLVSTTIAALLSANCPIASSGPWHTVIIDEASMVSGASLLYISSLATCRLLIAGDPRQLGPVFEWDRGHESAPQEIRKWIAEDPYEFTGVSSGAGDKKSVSTEDSRLVSITEQRRCHPRLWSFVSRFYPNIKTTVDLKRLSEIAHFPPMPGEPVVVLDVSDGRHPKQGDFPDESDSTIAATFESACLKSGRSWKNPPTAMMAIDVARTIKLNAPTTKVVIVTPYRGQAQLIRNWLDEEQRGDASAAHRIAIESIEIGTVHTFQGSEADVVIFDLVDGPPRRGLGILQRDDAGLRLTNVAITRARGKLILIIDRSWLRATSNREQAPLLWDLVFGYDERGGSAKQVPSAACQVLPPRYIPGRDVNGPDGTESPIEAIMLKEMLRRAMDLPSFSLQHRILNDQRRIVSRADFAFVNERLAIFCDGAMFHLPRHQWQRDLRQRRELARLGWKHLVFSGAEIMNGRGAACVSEIVDFFKTQRQST